MSNKRLTFYFNTDTQDQAELYTFLKNEPNMNKTMRDGLSLIVELRKINSSLPELLKTTLQNNGSINDLKAIIDVMATLSKTSDKTGKAKESVENCEPPIAKEDNSNTSATNEVIANAKKIFSKK
ncbi:hypothetical protein AB7Y07_16580 [Providencia rettgeri]|uniref:hypothetical protein n=1 Tax=Providencia TaxID=586 RepID=UPI0023494190|nr:MULTISPECIES: hypothetical protein [Providencia]EJF7713196.1 hypothetical protein [Providencia rettgeri]